MIGIGVVLLLLQGASGSADTSTYSSPRLREMVQAASVANRVAPAVLSSYRARIETEMSLILVDTLGRERIGQVEQIAGVATWNAATGYEVHVDGYRTQSASVPISMLGLVRGFSLPMLYGQRLLMGIEGSRTPAQPGGSAAPPRDTLVAVHPFATDRDRYYRFSGGDTIATLRTGTRVIPLVRIIAKPNLDLDTHFSAFDGEIDIDATRHEIVRMRGRFVVSEKRQASYSMLSRLITAASGTVAVAYVELINGEYMGRYWLPATQRMEFQATMALLGGVRSVFRIVTRFSEMSIDDTSGVATSALAYTRRRLTFAPTDSMGRFRNWRNEMGRASGAVTANDFDDIAPPGWISDGRPHYTLQPSRFDRLIHYNRIEGLYTGIEASLEMRDAAPGVVARSHVGYGWSDDAIRGGVSIARRTATSVTALTAQRELATTQDFQRDLENTGSSITALLSSVEEIDYVDRIGAAVSHTRAIGALDAAFFVVRGGIFRDRDVRESITRSVLRPRPLFTPNRYAATGSYGLASVGYQFHPDVSGETLQPGVGAAFSVEQAAGQLQWTRIEANLAARRYAGPLTVAARVDGGTLLGSNPPPQSLFEIGGLPGRLAGYGYKEFAGDQAVTARSFAIYALPLFRAPIRVGRMLLPGISPGVGVGIDAGWTRISSQGAQAAVIALSGPSTTMVSTETGAPRATASFGLTFFANTFRLALARPIDRKAPWKWVFGVGQGF